MISDFRSFFHVRVNGRMAASLALGVSLLIAFGRPVGRAQEIVSASEAARAAGAPVLTSFEQIWQMPSAEQQQWHRVRLDYLIYYYDPLWKALWGRSGEADSYLSLGSEAFPLKPGQRVVIEGLMQPARGMRVEEARAKVLEESVPLAVLSTTGQVARTERFNKRLVTMEGYVDRQTARDANHFELSLITEGRMVLVQFALRNGAAVPQLKGRFVRAKGVYFARSEADSSDPKIELWVQGPEDIADTGVLERDVRFDLPATPLAAFSSQPTDKLIRVTGTVLTQQPGRTVTIRDQTGDATVQALQTSVLTAGETIEAIGFPTVEAGARILRQGFFRQLQVPLTSVAELWELSESERSRWHRVRLDLVVYYFDPLWKAMWGRAGGSDDYLSLGSETGPFKPGQRLLIEGMVRPANNIVVEQAKVTPLEGGDPLVPAPTRGRIGDRDRLQKRWVEVEGYVDRQEQIDAQHCVLEMIVEGRTVSGRLLLLDGVAPPAWEGARLKLTGVYVAAQDPVEGTPSINIWVPDLRHVEMTGALARDERFNLPATPIDRLGSVSPGTLVRIAGTARMQQPGKQLTLRDETGQVAVESAQARIIPPGAALEAIGFPSVQGARVVLRDGLYRPARVMPPPLPAEKQKLRLADQLRELQSEEAARAHAVELAGLVSWARPGADFFYLLDASGGVCVYRPLDFAASLFVGERVKVTGVSAAGRYTPVVLASTLQRGPLMELPEARPVTLEQALTGAEEAQWVSMSGFVRAVAPEGEGSRATLTTARGEFAALLPAPHERWKQLAGSVVRVRGVCSAVTNDRRQLTGIELRVPLADGVEIEEPAPEDPFASPQRSIQSLRQFSPLPAQARRVRVGGIVTHHAAGRLIHIQDETEGLLILSRDTTPLVPGDRIEAVGFPGRENTRVVLRDAVYRRTEAGREPAPLPLRELAPLDAERDGRLVRVEGRLLDVSSQERGVRLIVQNGPAVFEALLEMERTAVPVDWKSQSHVALTGVYEIQFDEYRRPDTVRIQLRTPRDVTVLERAPWWTAARVIAAMGALAALIVLGFGWVLVLRRRVLQQKGVIAEQVESERAARLEAALTRASKLESLGVLAGGIAHDFNNLLTVVMGNLSLAKLDPGIESDTLRCLTDSERAATRARDLTQQLLTFAKGGEPMRTPCRLPDLVLEGAQFALHGSKVRCEFDIAPDLWLASVDKGQISQVVHNIVINASQAMPEGGRVLVALRNEELSAPRSGLAAGRYVVLSFRDAGTGIAPENLARIFEPYFTTKPQGTGLGLATVYSVVKRHGGHVEVKSDAGVGTTFTVWLPAVAATEVAAAPAAGGRPPGARVLLMDDEPAIRTLGSSVLKRLGCDVTAVHDGDSVVREFAAARAAGRPFDLVILDLTVPGGMGGAEAMTRLRAMDPEVRAIVSSGYSNDPVMANHREHGFRARVPKPYQASDLMEAVKDVLANRAG